jgi:hypothetical protein
MLTSVRRLNTKTLSGEEMWSGARHDNVWFMARSREELESFSECGCVVGGYCEVHAERPPLFVWNTPVRREVA